MADEIRADYDQLEQVASKFDNQSHAIQEMLQKIRSAMAKLEHGGWMGEGANAFFSEMHSLVLPAVQRLEKALENGSHATKEIVQHMRQAEDEACSPFRTS